MNDGVEEEPASSSALMRTEASISPHPAASATTAAPLNNESYFSTHCVPNCPQHYGHSHPYK